MLEVVAKWDSSPALAYPLGIHATLFGHEVVEAIIEKCKVEAERKCEREGVLGEVVAGQQKSEHVVARHDPVALDGQIGQTPGEPGCHRRLQPRRRHKVVVRPGGQSTAQSTDR